MTESFVWIMGQKTTRPGEGGGGNSHMEQTGMLVGKFEFNPKGDHLGVAQAFCDP